MLGGEGVPFLEFHSSWPRWHLSSVGCAHAACICFSGNPEGLEDREECFRPWGWLAWKVAITEVSLLWVLGHSIAHLCAMVSCPHSGAGWGLSQAPRLRLFTTRAAFSWHTQQKLSGSEAAFHFCAPGWSIQKIIQACSQGDAGNGTALAGTPMKPDSNLQSSTFHWLCLT